MNVQERKISPDEILGLNASCIWFLKEEENTPLFVQLDWQMCGGLSRALKKNSGSINRSLVPTLKRIPAPFVMLESQFDVSQFIQTCEGMKFDEVAIVCRQADSAKIIGALKKENTLSYPKITLVLVEERRILTRE